jgi:zinc protease
MRFITENLNKNQSGYLRDVAGTKEAVSQYSVTDIHNQYKKLHSPNKVMISVVGNFNPKKVKKMIENLFGAQNETDKQHEYPKDGIRENIVKVKQSPKTDLIFTSIEFPSINANEVDEVEKKYTDLALSILCGPMSSRLVKRLREEENLLYGIDVDQSAMETFGLTSIYYDIPVNNFEKAFKITVEELEKFYKKGTNTKELNHYKEYFSNRYLVNYDNVFSFSKLFRGPIFWGKKPMDLEKTIRAVKESTPGNINKIIPKLINMDSINSFGFGNVNAATEKVMKTTLKKYIK